jgi:hypothetical protein
MNYELETFWKEAVVACLMYNPDMNNLNQDSGCPSRNSNRAPLVFESRTLLFRKHV